MTRSHDPVADKSPRGVDPAQAKPVDLVTRHSAT
jgi:hypothetical protein